MAKNRKNLRYINSNLDTFFLEKEFKKTKLNRIYYLTLLLISFLKKINQLFKYRKILSIYFKMFFNKKYTRRTKHFYYRYLKSYKSIRFNVLYNIFYSIGNKNVYYNLDSFLFFKFSIIYKIKSFFLVLDKDIKKNFFLFKFFILLNINQLSSLVRIKRFKVFLLLLHFLFKSRKKG
jgi:hypothetical protein